MATKQLSVEELERCRSQAAFVMEQHRQTSGFQTATVAGGTLEDVFQALRARDVPWLQILVKVQQILTILFSQDDWQTKLVKILALFGLTA